MGKPSVIGSMKYFLCCGKGRCNPFCYFTFSIHLFSVYPFKGTAYVEIVIL